MTRKDSMISKEEMDALMQGDHAPTAAGLLAERLLDYRRTEKLVLQKQARERAERIRIANSKPYGKGK